jgi:hypothetical protein
MHGYVDRRVILVLQDGRAIVVLKGILAKNQILLLQTPRSASIAWMKVSKRSHISSTDVCCSLKKPLQPYSIFQLTKR